MKSLYDEMEVSMHLKLGQQIIDKIRGKKEKTQEHILQETLDLEQIQLIRKKKYEKIKAIVVNNSFNSDGIYDFLDSLTRTKYNIEDTKNVSDHDYCEEALDLIQKYKDGLILDCGCGFRKKYYENVVNYEICNYKTTDVLGVAEELPFKDNSFDAVFSFAVFEHLSNPKQSAKEIQRVLKPNGILLFDACFMQPFHGYPNHYFNITPSGAKLLFNDLLQLKKQYVSRNFEPIYTLQWYLSLWKNSLPEKVQKEFNNLTVEQMLTMSINKALDSNFCKCLSENDKKIICAGTRNIFVKE